MPSPPAPSDHGDDVSSLRRASLDYVQMVASSVGEPYTAHWAWNEFRLWSPPPGVAAAAEEMQQIFGHCTPQNWATVEALWQAGYDLAPAWYRLYVLGVSPDREQPALLAWWANPGHGEVELADVVAVRPSIDGLPASCVGTGDPQFEPSAMREAREPQDMTDLLPQIEMTEAEAGLFISHYLHQESHRVGPLWTTIDAQAAAARDQLMEIVTHAGTAGYRTDVNITVAVRDTAVTACRHHVYDPLPAYAGADEERSAGLHIVTHAHRDGGFGLEGSASHLRAVLTCVALYGGDVHLATVPMDGAAVPLAEETLYRVHYDWRCERVEGAEQRKIRELNLLIGDQASG